MRNMVTIDRILQTVDDTLKLYDGQERGDVDLKLWNQQYRKSEHDKLKVAAYDKIYRILRME